MKGARGQFLLATLMYASYFIGIIESWGHQVFMATAEEQMLIHDVVPKLMNLYSARNSSAQT